MARIDGEIVIDRPVDVVFDYVADQSNEPKYFRPGRSSDDGGIEEFPLLRDSSRSSRATCSVSSFSCACCASTRSRSSAISSSRAAQLRQPGAGGGNRTQATIILSRLSVVNTTRQGGRRSLLKPAANTASH